MSSDSAPPAPRPCRDWLRPPLLWVTAPLAAGVAALSIHLWPQWSDNPDLSHGLFAPVVFALLLHHGVRHGTRRWLPASSWTGVGVGLLLAGAWLLLAIAGLLAASLAWSHALVSLALCASLAATTLAGVLLLARADVRAVPLNWPVLAAIGLWLLAAPLPPGTAARLTMELQGWVTSGVLASLHFLGISAHQIGNVIELANTSVGVEEACSGIRSLLSCTYAGLFFGAWLVRRPWARFFLFALAPLLAIAMNFARSLALTIMADRGVEIAGFWHDATGFAILGVTAGVLALCANALGEEPDPDGARAEPSEPPPRLTGARHWAAFPTGCAAMLALVLFFVFYQRPAAVEEMRPFEPDHLLPREVAGWRVHTSTTLYQFSEILQTTHLAQRTYIRQRGSRTDQVTVYVAYWAPAQAPVSMVASHTPDACWPGAGWVARREFTARLALDLAGTALPPAEYRFFNQGPLEQHVWFWHLYDGRVINYGEPYSVPTLLGIALRYGFRREGSQYFIRISSNLPWDRLENEPLLHQLASNLAPLGLSR